MTTRRVLTKRPVGSVDASCFAIEPQRLVLSRTTALGPLPRSTVVRLRDTNKGVPDPHLPVGKDALVGLVAQRRWGPAAMRSHDDTE
jgi:hypothetical protein